MHCTYLNTGSARVNTLDALVSRSNTMSHYCFSAGWLCWLWLLTNYVRTSGDVVWVAEFLRCPAFWAWVPLLGIKKFLSSICSGNAWIEIWAWIWIQPQSSGNHFFKSKWRAHRSKSVWYPWMAVCTMAEARVCSLEYFTSTGMDQRISCAFFTSCINNKYETVFSYDLGELKIHTDWR